MTGYKQAGVLPLERDPQYRKYKKTAQVLYSYYPVCRPSLDFPDYVSTDRQVTEVQNGLRL